MLSLKRSRFSTPFLNPWTSLGFVFLALCAALLIYAAGKGIDFTDESFYLLYYAAPARHLFNLSWFQFVGSLWHDLAGGSVFGLRLCGYATMFACAILCLAGLSRAYPILLAADCNRGFALLTVCSIYATLYMPVMLTPGYNSIDACGLALTLGGVALIPRGQTRSFVGSILVGLGCAFVLFGKPNCFLALLVLLALWAWRVRPGRKPVLVAAFVCAVTVFAVIAMHLPISETWRLVWEPVNFLLRVYKVYESMRFEGLGKYVLRSLVTFCSLSAFVTICPKRFAIAGVLTASAVITFMLSHSNSVALGALAPSLALGLLLLTAVQSRRQPQDIDPEGPSSELILLSFAFPICYFHGSAVPFTMTLGNASFFWWITVLLCLGRLRPVPRIRALSFFCCAACALWLVFWAWHAFSSPYRHGSRIWEETEALTDVPGFERVHVTPFNHSWIQHLRGEAESAGFRPGMPVLDISGGVPGLMLLIDASPAGSNWIFGGYKMSTEYLRFALDRISPEDRRRCWMLRLKGDPPYLRFDLGVLREYGIDPEGSYEAVWQGREPFYQEREIILLRPVGLIPSER